MGQMIAIRIVVVAASLSAGAEASDPWDRMPLLADVPDMTLLGAPMGQPHNIPACPDIPSWRGNAKTDRIVSPSDGDRPCLRNMGDGKAWLYPKMWPNGVRGGGLDVITSNGSIVSMTIQTVGIRAQDELLEMLTEKYGKPSVDSKKAVQNRMGASFEAISAAWRFNGLRVMFSGVSTDLDHGAVVVMTDEGWVITKGAIDQSRASRVGF